MNKRMIGRFLAAAVLLVGASIAGASTKTNGNIPRTDEELAKAVTHEVLMYPYYTIWDDIRFQVTNGQVQLVGEVNQPFKKEDIARIVERVPGVAGVTNDLKVLPLSPFDDRLRIQVAKAVYGDPALARYRGFALPPIHIIVENGHVTLDGVVANTMDKQIAGMRASSVGLSFGPVTNNLQVDQKSASKS
jgi:hyperosmotically inducible protein